MLLSDQQKYIISVLRQIKYIRARQLHAMTAQHYRTEGIDISQARMDAMLRQLRAMSSFVRFQGDVVCYGERTVDPRYLEAIDVMLELTRCAPEFYSAERLEKPFLLRFTGGSENALYLFSVAWMGVPRCIARTQRMEGERIIWIADRLDRRGLMLPRHHIFAARQEDGNHRFFGSQEPKKI